MIRFALVLVGLVMSGALAAEDMPLAMPAPPSPASDVVGPTLDSGDTAWMLTSSVLVLLMTIPGLCLFYAGLVRTRNVLSVFAQCFAVTCLVTVLWTLYGYSLAFDASAQEAGALNWNSFIGGFAKLGHVAVTPDALVGRVPEPVFSFFQLTFAIITPALLVGAFAERMRFSALLWLCGLWVTLVYIPICHMAWSGPGSFFGGYLGVLDLAGGTVVEVNSGVAGLVCALVIGRRIGWPKEPMLPHNTTMCITGACLLWIGWFGFNAGSAGGANAQAARAAIATHIAAATAALTWMIVEWRVLRKPTGTGMATGAVGGLVAITPACGFVGPLGALAIGVAAGIGCFLAVTRLKKRFAYDDSLDVFGVHGVGGMIGLLLTGVFCAPWLGGSGFTAGYGMGKQVAMQAVAMVVTIAWSAGGTWLILKAVDAIVGLRVRAAVEENGLDLAEHGEVAYNP